MSRLSRPTATTGAKRRSRMSRVRKRMEKTTRAVATTSGLADAVDIAVFRRARAAVEGDGTAALLLAPPGGGNIGDQAMVESFLENTPGPVRIILRRETDIVVSARFAERVEIVPIPALVYGDGRAHRDALREYRRVLASASSFRVVGADIMDGAYNLRASARRATLAYLAATAGVPSAVLGFSWNTRPERAALRALTRASQAGVRLMLRDPLSAERARADGLQNVELVADTVFAATSSSAAVVDSLLGADPAPYAVVNASGLVARGGDQATAYARIVAALRAAGLTVVLLPHVVRSSADDLVACRAVVDAVVDATGTADGVILVDRVIAPGEVRGLCARATVVVTGRMHLAIQSMWSGVPAITLSTQGKVEGLMAAFGVEDLCVTPGPGLADRILPLLDDVLARRADFAMRIGTALPSIVELARRNFTDAPASASVIPAPARANTTTEIDSKENAP